MRVSLKKNFVLGVFFALFLIIYFNTYSYAQDAVAEGGKGLTFWQLVFNGGWVMLVVGLLSILTLTLVIDLFFKIRPAKMISFEYVENLRLALKEKDLKKAMSISQEQSNCLSEVIMAGLKKTGQSLKTVQDSMMEAGVKAVAKIEQKINYLSAIATIAPMLGLLGTVLGMIQAFNVIAYEAGLGKPTALAGGIAQAMITTAFGLIVAIPAMAFHFYFKGAMDKILSDIENIATDISLFLGKRG
jgi:biopolymer transport protein ExbB